MKYKYVLCFYLVCVLLISGTCKKENLLTLLTSCTHDFSEVVKNEEYKVLPAPCPTGIWYEEEPPLSAYNYYSPVFNPNNPNQIAYIRFDTLAPYQQKGALELHTFDFCSGEVSIVNRDSIVSYTVEWSSKDWLLYRKWFKDIYKIKSNGQSKTKVVDTYISLSQNRIPIWSGSGDHLAWSGDERPLIYGLYDNSTCGFVIMNENGMKVDTISEFCKVVPSGGVLFQNFNLNLEIADHFSWSKDNTKIACDASAYVDYLYLYGLFYYDFTLDEIVFVDDLNAYPWYGKVTDTDWTPDSRKLVWSTERSVGWKDIYSGERKIILTGHENRKYESIDVSPDGKTIAIERLNRVNVNGCTKVERAIYLVNMDGTDERRVLVPE